MRRNTFRKYHFLFCTILVLTISSGARMPNCTLLTRRTVALESVVLMMGNLPCSPLSYVIRLGQQGKFFSFRDYCATRVAAIA